jgi:hypothetical protein
VRHGTTVKAGPVLQPLAPTDAQTLQAAAVAARAAAAVLAAALPPPSPDSVSAGGPIGADCPGSWLFVAVDSKQQLAASSRAIDCAGNVLFALPTS